MGAKIERFEDLVAWQKSRALTRAIYLATRQGQFARDFGLAGQIQRAAVSVMSNIAEGFERGGRPEFYQFLTIAKASAAEVRSQLYVALDVGHVDLFTFEDLLVQAEEVARIIAGLRSAVGRQREEGRVTSGKAAIGKPKVERAEDEQE
jgi:four helix bundle protein